MVVLPGRGSEQGRRWAAPIDARHAGPAFALLRRGKRVPALPASAWPLAPVAPPERRVEAGCPSPVSTVEAAVAARFVPPVFSSSFSGARAKRKRLRIDGLHSPKDMPPVAAAASQERAQAVRSGRPHSLLSAPLGSGWTPELLAAWSLSRSSNVWIFVTRFFPISGHLIECGLVPIAQAHRDSLISTPPCFKCRFRRAPQTPHVESRHFKHGPRNRRAIRRECAPTVQTSRPFAFSAA